MRQAGRPRLLWRTRLWYGFLVGRMPVSANVTGLVPRKYKVTYISALSLKQRLSLSATEDI